MRKVLCGVLLGVLAWLMTSPGAAHGQGGRGPWQPDAARHGWVLDYRQAKEFARQSGKPLMVVFRCVP
jgi:hypothetical protein